jgi:hypothetical protein
MHSAECGARRRCSSEEGGAVSEVGPFATGRNFLRGHDAEKEDRGDCEGWGEWGKGGGKGEGRMGLVEKTGWGELRAGTFWGRPGREEGGWLCKDGTEG